MFHLIDNTGNIVQVGKCRFPVFPGINIDDVNGCTSRTEVDFIAGKFQIVLWIAGRTIQNPDAPGQSCLPPTTEETSVDLRLYIFPLPLYQVNTGRNCLRQPKILKHIHDSLIDLVSL